jgi:putative SOS response-associated peptidase YedK
MSEMTMCGQYALTAPPEVVRACFGYADAPQFPPRPRILPTEPIAIVVARPFTQGRERRFLLVRWGFLPGFVKDPQNFPLIVNARAESVRDRPSFAAAFKRRRALAPADGFYLASGKKLRLFAAPDRALFGLAALYETYLDASGGEIDTACILTTEARTGERVPVVVPRESFSAWLDCDTTPLAAASALLRPAPEGLLTEIEGEEGATLR